MGNSNNNSTGIMSSSSISEIIASNQIVVFQSSTCPYCIEAVKNLKSAGLEYYIYKKILFIS